MASTEPTDAVERTERARMRADELSWALRGVTRAAADVESVIARRVGLRPMDYAAFSHVFSDDTVGPNGLRARLGLSSGSVSELLDRLERSGHLERHREGTDRRRVSLRATPASVDRVLGELAPLFAELDALAEQVPPEHRDAVGDYLRRAAEVLRAFEQQAAR